MRHASRPDASRSMESQISGVTAIVLLQLSNLNGVPGALLHLSGLTHLTLDRCRPSAADLQSMSRLHSLAQLRLCSTADLGAVLPSLTAPSTLTSLILDRDRLEALPSFSWLPQLSRLILSHNRFVMPTPSALHFDSELAGFVVSDGTIRWRQ